MRERRAFKVGDIVRTRKTHPCGADLWYVMRVGADFRMSCEGCGRVVMLSRPKFEKAVKEVVGSEERGSRLKGIGYDDGEEGLDR